MNEFMLSLASNPYDPFVEYDLWLKFDYHEGFDTQGLYARCISTSEVLSEPDQALAQEQAIDAIIENPNFNGLYKKVKRSR